MCKNDERFELTDLDVVLPLEINGEIIDTEMDLYVKAVIVDGLPYMGYYVIPRGDSLVDHEPMDFDLDSYLMWSYDLKSFFKNEDGFATQYFKYTIYRNNKEFCSGVFKDFNTTETNMRNMINNLHSNRKMVDFRKKNFKEDLIGKTFNVNNVIFTVLEYFEGRNEIKVKTTKDGSESVLSAITVNA